MNRNSLGTLLTGLLLIAVAGSTVLAFAYIQKVRQVQRLQEQVSVINRNRALAGALVNDALEYSKKNPEILPILQSIGIRPRAGGPPQSPAVPE